MAEWDSNKIKLPLALSSSKPSWWDLHHHATCSAPPTSLWNNTAASLEILWANQNNSNASACDQEDVSITASNHSTLTVDESFHRFVEPSSSTNTIITEPTDDNSNLWSQLLLGVEGRRKMQAEVRDEVGENLLNALSLKSFSSGMFEPSACSDYLKEFDIHHHENWVDNNGDQYRNSNTNSSFHNNPVNTRSIAPPDQSPLVQHLVPHPCNDFPSIDQYLHPDNHSDQTKQSLAYQRQLSDMGPCVGNSGFDCYSYIFNHTRPYNHHQEESDQAGPSLGKLFPKSVVNHTESGHMSVGGNWRSPRESNMHNQHGFTPSVMDPVDQSRSRLLSKPALLKSLSLLETRKQQQGTINEGNGRGQVASTNEGKKKRSNDISQSSIRSFKKFKHEASSSFPSTASSSSSLKARDTQTPKVKIAAEKISALQQIVSPYGKTDTASVLQEAIGYIKCHQEQVQLLSNPYLKSRVNKLQEARSMDIKFEKGERNKVLDLKSKGLCLVPTSSVPQVYKDSAGPDYWLAYRGCMYR